MRTYCWILPNCLYSFLVNRSGEFCFSSWINCCVQSFVFSLASNLFCGGSVRRIYILIKWLQELLSGCDQAYQLRLLLFKVDVEGAVVGVPETRQTRCLNVNSLEQMGATGNRPKENRSVEYWVLRYLPHKDLTPVRWHRTSCFYGRHGWLTLLAGMKSQLRSGNLSRRWLRAAVKKNINLDS